MTKSGRLVLVLALALILATFAAMACARAQEPTATPRPVATVALGVPTPAPVPATPTPAPAKVELNEWVVGFSEDPTIKVTPLTPGGGSSGIRMAFAMVHEDLLTPQGYDLNLKPRAAESWEWSGSTLIYHLRKGIKGQKPGTELTSADVKYTYDTIIGDPRLRVGIEFNSKTTIEAPDPYTVNIKFKSPFATFLALKSTFMVPKERKGNEEAYDKAPWSYGFYEPIQWEKDKPVKLEAFKNHYMGVAAPPKVTIIFMREASTRVAALLAGQAHVVQTLSIAQAPTVMARPELAVSRIPKSRQLIWFFNYHAKNPYFSKLKVRQALNYAMNKEVVVNDILQGYGSAMGNPMIRGWLGYEETDDLKPYPYDPAKAVQLLKEAGFDRGFSFDFRSLSGVFQKDQEIAEAYASMWEAIGLKPKLSIIERGIMFDTRAKSLDWDIIGIGQWGPAIESSALLSFMALTPGTKVGDETPEMEPFRQLLTKAVITLDSKERAKLYGQLARMIHEQALNPLSHTQDELYGLRRDTGWIPFIQAYYPEAYFFNYHKLAGYGPDYKKWEDILARNYWNN